MKKTIHLRHVILAILSFCLCSSAMAENPFFYKNNITYYNLFSTVKSPVSKDVFYLTSRIIGEDYSKKDTPSNLLAAITSTETSICVGSSTTLIANPTGGTEPFTYLWSNGETTPSVTVSPNTSTTYSLTVTDATGTENSTSQLIEVKTAPSAPFSVHFKDCGSTLPKAHSIPYGKGQTFEWYTNADRTGALIPSILVDEAAVPGDVETSYLADFVYNRGTTVINTNYYVFEKGANGCYSPATEVPITVYPVPQVAPTIPVNYACGPSYTFTAQPHDNNTIEWRTDPRAIFFGQTLGTENTYTLSNTENKKDSLWVFEVSPQKCYGEPVLVKLVPTPPAPTVANISLCVGDAPTPIFTQSNYRWYTTATGDLASGDFPRFPADIIQPSFPSSNTYFISQIVDGCESATRSELTATVNPIPDAPQVIDIEYCETETATALTAGGSNLKWFDANNVLLNGAPTPSTSVIGETIYYVSQTLNNCESPKAVIHVKIKARPSTPSVLDVKYCKNETPIALTAISDNLKWYDASGIQLNEAPIPSTITVGTTSYFVTQTALNGCESPKAEIKVTINAQPAINISANPASICAGQKTQLSATVSGLSSGFTISWDNGLGNEGIKTTPILNANTTFSASVTTTEGCSATANPLTVIVSELPSTPSVSTITQPTCSISTGTIVLTAQTGVEYSFDNGATYTILNEKSGLNAGDYSIKVKNAAGCESGVLIVKINMAPSAPSAPSVSSVTQPTCSVSTGKIVLTAQIGVEYSFDNGITYQASNEKTGLSAGDYSIKVKNAAGCESGVLSVTINAAPSAPSTPSVLSTTQPTCSVSTGKIVLTAQTGVEYSFDNGATYTILNEKSGLNAGDYSIKVKNAAGCESGVLTVKINAAPSAPSTPSVLSTTQPTCSVSTGTIALTAQTGVTYSFDNGLTYQAESVKTGLNAGIYSIKVKNADGCESGVLNVTINAAPSVPSTPSVSTITQPTCSVSTGKIVLTAQTGVEYSFDNGLTYQASNEKTGLNAGDYSIKIKNATGCESGVLIVKINAAPSAPSTPSVSTITQPTCSVSTGKIVLMAQTGVEYSFDNGVTYQVSNEKQSLVAGTYKIKVKNVVGCESPSIEVVINSAVTNLPNFTLNVVQPTCYIPKGTITVNLSGSGYTFSFDNGITFQASNIKSGLAIGTYNILIKNASGCVSAPKSVSIIAPVNTLNPIITALQSAVCSGDNVKLSVSPNCYTCIYKWSNGATTDNINVYPNITTTYSVTVTNGGCSTVVSKTITVYPKLAKPKVTIIQPACGTMGSITITNLPVGASSKINGINWTAGKTVYNNLNTGTYTIKFKLGECESEEEKVVLNDAGFTFDPTKCYKIVNKNSGKVLDVFQNKMVNNTPIIQYALNGGSNQKWQFSATTDGYLKLKVQSSGKYLACHDNWNGANVYQYDYYSGGQKDWKIECLGNGDYRIVHRYSGKYLSVENSSKSDAAKVEIRYWMNSDAQKWQIVEVPCSNTSSNLRQAGYMTAKAEAEVKQINVTWYSNMGYKTDYYTVEKFNEQKGQFEEVSTQNNTQFDDELHDFTYLDMSPLEGDNVYRVKAIFNDGSSQLSQSLKVAFGNIKDIRLFPNPAVDYVEILLNEAPKNTVTLTLNNMLGLPVIVKSYDNEQRMYFEIKDIPNGVYQLHISQKGKRSIVKQVVVQK